MVGWWLVYCLVIYTGFESELISHLTVNKARTRPPETLEDLVNTDGWEWGIDAWIWTGVPLEYFTRHKDQVVVEIYKHLEVSCPSSNDTQKYVKSANQLRTFRIICIVFYLVIIATVSLVLLKKTVKQ